MIGDRATAALVGADTAIDWYCPSRFDAAAACFRLVDPDGGAIAFELDGTHSPGEQHYVGNGATPVLRTTLQSGDATIEVSDHLSDDRLVRIVKVLRGPATVVLRVEPGWRFGRPRKVERWSRGISFGPLTVEGLAPDESVVLDTGEFAVVTLGDPLDAPFTLAAALDHQRRVIEAWQPAMAEIPYDGPFRDGVVAAARTIRMLTDRSTGAVLSSCTTSLPVQLGNERSVDQRLAWAGGEG